jgi:cell division protein FtsW (lipid II flippase)
LGQAVVGGRGIAEPVSYAENTFAVFVLAEHGAVGGLLVLTLYLLLTFAVWSTAMIGTNETPASYRASRALFLVAAFVVAIPAVYVALSNLGVVPITGQNMPFLGLNAWSDVAICAGVVGILITGAIRRMEEAR